jgi:hypothetical protein
LPRQPVATSRNRGLLCQRIFLYPKIPSVNKGGHGS